MMMHILTTKQLKPKLELSLFDVKEYCKNQASTPKKSPNNLVEMMFATYAAHLMFLTLRILEEKKTLDVPNGKRISGEPPKQPILASFNFNFNLFLNIEFHTFAM